MRTYSTAVLLLAGPCLMAATAPDTARLASHLRAVRGLMRMPAADYWRLRSEYLKWLDARMKAGVGVVAMNEELKAVGLFHEWGEVADEMMESHAGYLEKLSTKAVRGTDEILVIEAGIYGGGGCSLDDTAVLYDQESHTRVAAVSANQPQAKDWYWYSLSGLDVGPKDSTGERLVASGWVVSNCTSNWNGKEIRIDRVKGGSVTNILKEDIAARDRDPEEAVAVTLQEDVVTFRYDGAAFDSKLMIVPSLVRCRISNDRAVQVDRIVLTRAGFVHEWLDMTDEDAVRWSEGTALDHRRAIVSALKNHDFEWTRIANCGGTPVVWEIAIQPKDSEKLFVFRITGSRATELRMAAVTDHWTGSCIPDDVLSNLAGLGTELPW